MTDIPSATEGVKPNPEQGAYSGMLGWVSSVDHKVIGIMYFWVVLFFFLVGGIEALLLRIQLAQPRNAFLSPAAYNQLFTMHGTTMIFLVVVPTLIGFAVYFVPLMIGARDVAFPRLNALSFWMVAFGGLFLYFSFLAGGAPNVGWFSYAPLSEMPYSTTQGMDYWALGLLAIGIGTVTGGINLIVTVLTLRAPGMSLRRVPLFVWMVFVNSFIILFALPPLNASLVMLIVDRLLGGHFFTPATGGSAILWEQYFWAFGHPEVYIMILPAWGMISEVIPVFSRKHIFGYGIVAGSSVAIAVLSFLVYAHHMFTVGLGNPFDIAFSTASFMIAVPTGIKIFNWAATMWGGKIRFTTSMAYAVSFLVLFTIGGITGVSFAAVPIDWQVEDTYYVVAHFHYVLFGGTVFALMAGLYYWFPKITGRMLSERLGMLNFWLTFIGFNMTFFIQHILGLMGMSRRIYTYPNLPGWGTFNLISTIGAFVLAFGILILLVNMYYSIRKGAIAGNNPWKAWTLEWLTSSPPPPQNFDEIPPVRSQRPLWDLTHPEDPDWKHAGG